MNQHEGETVIGLMAFDINPGGLGRLKSQRSHMVLGASVRVVFPS